MANGGLFRWSEAEPLATVISAASAAGLRQGAR